jgi:asparagine synthase (glutamine-hydrolysing)
MCGLAGWVDFDRDLTGLGRTVADMTATLAPRGPDDWGLWASSHAVLGHTRLAVIDPEGGRQPMHAARPDDDLPVLAHTGEVYNFPELKEELAGLGHSFRTAGDTEVVLRAYLEWGEAFAERLNGMYAIALWDPRSRELFLVRDRMGVKPLFYHPTPTGVLFGSEPKAILAHPQAEAVVDGEGLAELFAVVHTPGHAVFQGMHEVVPGTVVRFDRAGHTTRTYWRMPATPHDDDLATTIDRVRTLLEDIIERQLVADVPVATLLGDGQGSGAVTALAAAARKQQGRAEAVKAFSAGFTDDGPYAAAEVAAHCGAEHHVIELENADVLDPDVRTRVLRCQDLPVSTDDSEPALHHLCRALKRHVTVALCGEGADALFGGHDWLCDPEAVESGTFPWYATWRRHGGLAALKEIGLWDRLGLGTYAAERYAEALAQVPRLPGEPPREARMRELAHLTLSRRESFPLDRADRLGTAAGLEVRVPFTDHRLVEYVFNVPWAMKTFDGRPQSLLRAATAHVLPEPQPRPAKSPRPSPRDLEHTEALRANLAALLHDGGSPVLRIVPAEGIRKLLAKPVESYAGQDGPWGIRAVMERLVGFHTWVREYGVRLED